MPAGEGGSSGGGVGRIGGDGGVRDGHVAGGGGRVGVVVVGGKRRGTEGEARGGHVSGFYIGRLREGDVDEWCVQRDGRGRKGVAGYEGDGSVSVPWVHVQGKGTVRVWEGENGSM